MNIKSSTNLELLNLALKSSRYCVGMEGNVSGKVDDKTFLIKASGSNLSTLSSNELVLHDFNGKQLNNLEKRGSMELGFHTFLLGFDKINFISHTHPVNTLIILCGPNETKIAFSEKRLFPDQVVFNGVKSCLVPYAKPGHELTEKVSECVNRFIRHNEYFPKLILLENHGIISCGETIDECNIINDICEKSAIILNGNKLKDTVFLSDKEVNDLVIDKFEKYRKSLI